VNGIAADGRLGARPLVAPAICGRNCAGSVFSLLAVLGFSGAGCWKVCSGRMIGLVLGLSALVLSRNPDAFREKAPRVAGHPAIQFHPGDVRSFEFPKGGFSHIIHAATESSARLNAEDPLTMFDTILDGTRRTLEFACHCGAGKFLLTSSGAVYGRQPPEMARVPEDYAGAPDPIDSRSAYGEGKRAAETLCTLFSRQHGIEAKIARCFAFVGPHLPLDIHFAIGNFIRDGLKGGPIVVSRRWHAPSLLSLRCRPDDLAIDDLVSRAQRPELQCRV